jgi:hypothetical protein
VYAAWHALQAESVSGWLVNNISAGGTIDTERLFLTGFSSLTDIRRPTDSYVRYFNSQGYYTEGFHAGDAWFYKRNSVTKYLGFDRYRFVEDFADATRRDDYFFPKIRELYSERDASVPYFAHHLTYQNHSPYHVEGTAEPWLISREGLTDGAFNILNNYLTGIYDTSARIWEFVGAFRDDPEPVVLIFYGDHKPGLGSFNSVYDDLGIDIDPGDEEGFYNLYTTPYAIWANDAAKTALGNDFTGDGGDFSPCFLMNRLFSLCGWGGDAYMKAASELFAVVDVLNTPTGAFRERGELTAALSPDAAALYGDFQIMEYYRRYNL